MGAPAQAMSGGRDADLELSSPYYEPLVGYQYQPNAFESFTPGSNLLNPSYAGSPIVGYSGGGSIPFDAMSTIRSGSQAYANTERTIEPFSGWQDFGVLSPAPTITPKVSGALNTPGSSILSSMNPVAAGQSVSSGPVNVAGGGAASTSSSGKSFGSSDPSSQGKIGSGGAIDKIFGKNSDTLKKVLGFVGAMGIDKVVKTPSYPDMSGAAASIMAQGPTTAAGQEAERRMVDYLQKGPRITPLSEEYIQSISKMFDDEMNSQLKLIETKMQAQGSGGFGGGSGDAQYIKGQIINKYSLEKLYYTQKLLDERMREDTRNYYQTLNKVYGISEDELQQLAKLEVEELAKQFDLDYSEAEDLKKTLSDMVYEFTWGETDKLSQIRSSLGERMLQQVIGGMNSGGQPNV